MDNISYALCEHKCKKSSRCLRYINRNSGQKAIVDFKPVCGANNKYKWFYKADESVVEAKKYTKERRKK